MTRETSTEGVRSEDTGLPIIDESGTELGVIHGVVAEDVTIDPADTLDDATMTTLGWDDPNALQTLPRAMLERVPSGIGAYVTVFRFQTGTHE
ncbi:hypothetical protein [Halocatena pleomorpha]|uniref:PRC-barrel domain containing protein n=1 Tax=Halocatena pleomorpha TaxID=1785090 RepID=A0A3P3RLT3_9EURY|nr:hypothetical protein [Halocatena pleomorpha]RRJ33779.1 hypothetical protein EIK79_03045 [Halocatena pleomorpha]